MIKFEKKSVFYFFFRLDRELQSGQMKPYSFLAYWNQIPDHDFDAKELNNILYQPVSHTSPHAHDNKNLQSLKCDLRTILCKNIDVWQREAIQKLPTFNAQDLSNTLLAFSRLGLVPSEEFMAGWLERVETPLSNFGKQRHNDNDRNFNAQELSNTLLAFSRLGLVPSKEFMAGWLERAKKILRAFNEQALGNAYYAIAIQHILNPTDQTQKIANMLQGEIQKRSFTNTLHKNQIAQAAFIFDHDTRFRISPDKDTPSRMEKQLCSLFRKAGHAVSTDYKIKKTQQKPDLVLKDDPEQAFIIEADGWWHFIRRYNQDTEQLEIAGYNGSTVLQTASLCKVTHNAIVLRMPYPVLDVLDKHLRESMDNIDAQALAQVTDIIIRPAIIQGSGAYISAIDPQTGHLHAVRWKPERDGTALPFSELTT